uniref:UNC-45/Cro1/She4 central domain-containing protein n=1 Tax=Anopheles maculatus TaxID=74869 RepID=A0A182T2Z1_9DIPT
DEANAFKERGNAEFKEDCWEASIKWYTKAIHAGEKHKDLPVFYKNRAAAYLKLEQYENAHKDCTESLELCANDPKALFRRFQAFEALGRFEEAYKDLRTIHTHDPNNKTIKPHLERLHAIVQERARERAQTSNKVTKMFEIAFDIGAPKDKREQAMSNIVVLAREQAGVEVMMKEGVVTRIGKLLKVEKNSEIVTNAIRAIDGVCLKSPERTKQVINELGIPWFLQILDCSVEERVAASQHCMQTVLNSISGMDNKEDTKPNDALVKENQQIIETLLTCLLYSVTDRTITGMARDSIMELLIRNVHWKTLNWAERLVELKGLMRLMEVCSELEEYKYETCECLIAAASKKDKAKGLVQSGAEILKRLYASKNEEIRVRALVGLCKIGSSGGLDASIRPFADGSTKKLAEACRRFLVKPGKDKDIRKFAAEGLAYLTLDAEVKEKLVEDRAAIKGLIELAKTGDQSALYGVVTTLVNLVNAYDKQEMVPELVELAKFAKHHIPEEHELDDPDFVSARVIVLANEGVTSGLVALCKTESDNSKEMIARVFNALCSEQEARGKVVQQGGAKVLLPLSLNGTANGKRHAAQALSRIGITINPEVAFPGQRNLEVIRPLMNQLHPDYTSLENFEALMALCNLASMNESTRQRILKEQGMIKIETYMGEDHLMLRRAATQVMCNMVQSPDAVELCEKPNDRVKMLALLCEEEDEDTALAASGALAYLTSVSERCCEKMFEPAAWLNVFHTLVANPSPGVQHRGIVIIRNIIKTSKQLASRLFDTDLLQMMYGVTQLNDETRAKAIECAQECLKLAEEYRLIQENADADMAPDVFKEHAATIEEIDN